MTMIEPTSTDCTSGPACPFDCWCTTAVAAILNLATVDHSTGTGTGSPMRILLGQAGNGASHNNTEVHEVCFTAALFFCLLGMMRNYSNGSMRKSFDGNPLINVTITLTALCA